MFLCLQRWCFQILYGTTQCPRKAVATIGGRTFAIGIARVWMFYQSVIKTIKWLTFFAFVSGSIKSIGTNWKDLFVGINCIHLWGISVVLQLRPNLQLDTKFYTSIAMCGKSKRRHISMYTQRVAECPIKIGGYLLWRTSSGNTSGTMTRTESSMSAFRHYSPFSITVNFASIPTSSIIFQQYLSVCWTSNDCLVVGPVWLITWFSSVAHCASDSWCSI